MRAVMREPERSAASTTASASEDPAMMRFGAESRAPAAPNRRAFRSPTARHVRGSRQGAAGFPADRDGRARRPAPRSCRSQGSRVGTGIDAAGKARNHRVAGRTCGARDHSGEFCAVDRAVARGPRCRGRVRRQSPHRPWRREAAARRRSPQGGRIIGFADADETGAETLLPPRSRAGPRRGCAIRIARVAPPRADRPGSASSAASAEPKELMRSRNVCGPTLSERMRRSQAMRWRSVRLMPFRPPGLPMPSSFLADRLSVPAISREMLARCLIQTITDMTTAAPLWSGGQHIGRNRNGNHGESAPTARNNGL